LPEFAKKIGRICRAGAPRGFRYATRRWRPISASTADLSPISLKKPACFVPRKSVAYISLLGVAVLIHFGARARNFADSAKEIGRICLAGA